MKHVFKQVYCKHFVNLKMLIKGNNSVYHKIMHNMLYHQTLWIQVSTNILLVLIRVQTSCKGYQQVIKVAASKERVNNHQKHRSS